jgi:hypothetical protein
MLEYESADVMSVSSALYLNVFSQTLLYPYLNYHVWGWAIAVFPIDLLNLGVGLRWQTFGRRESHNQKGGRCPPFTDD